MKGNPKSHTLLALTAAAAALPGYSGTAEAWSESEPEAVYRFSHYGEKNLPPQSGNGLSSERYEVISHQFVLVRPAGEEWDFSAELLMESMSGASPWYVVPGTQGEPVQVMSGASIEDERYALQARARKYRASGSTAVSLGVSQEEDYLAVSAGVEGAWEFNRSLDTLSAGIGYSRDQLEPTDGGSGGFPNRVAEADKDSVSAYAGWSRILTPQTVGQLSVSYARSEGYLSDPYKLAYVDGEIRADSRPPERNQFAVNLRWRHYLRGVEAALHLDTRYFRDDWGVTSETVEVAWVQSLPNQWRLTPSLRWYEQGYADFYRAYYTASRDDGFYSSDYRLSPYGALSARVALEKSWERWSISLSYESYDSDADYAVHSIDRESPGLVDFSVASAAFSYRWGLAAAKPAAGPRTQASEENGVRVVPPIVP